MPPAGPQPLLALLHRSGRWLGRLSIVADFFDQAWPEPRGELLCQRLEIPVELFREGWQQGVPLILQQTADQSECGGGSAARVSQQFRHDPVRHTGHSGRRSGRGRTASRDRAGANGPTGPLPSSARVTACASASRAQRSCPTSEYASLRPLPSARARGPGGFPDDCVWRWLRRHRFLQVTDQGSCRL